MDREALLSRARTRGVRPLVYWCVRAVLQPFFHVWFRLGRIGREHIPASGPAIIASNHRSFLDPFVIAVMARRPIYFVAKKELFLFHPVVSWLLSALGAFPIDRGASDQESMATARTILDRGDIVLMFPEGTRIRPGALGRPKRGVGRLALETGAPVVPVAVIGTEAVRDGWRIRPHKVRIRAGRALTFPRVEKHPPALPGAVPGRIWPGVELPWEGLGRGAGPRPAARMGPCGGLRWEWLGGGRSLRGAAVVGAGARGTALAVALARAGLEVDLATRTAGQAARIGAAGANEPELPGVPLPDGVRVVGAGDIDLDHHDLVAFAVPPEQLPAAVAVHGPRIPARAGVVVVGADSERARFVAAHVPARAVAALAVGDSGGTLASGAPVVVACADEAFRRQLATALETAGLAVATTRDVSGAALAPLPTLAQRRSRAA